jgi:hypothetical protein
VSYIAPKFFAPTAFDDADDVRGPVEDEARLELPGHQDAHVRRHLADLLPGLHDVVHRLLLVDRRRLVLGAEDVGRLDGVDAEERDAQVPGELEVLLHHGQVGGAAVGGVGQVGRMVRIVPHVGRDARELQAARLDQVLERLAGLEGGMVLGIRVREERPSSRPSKPSFWSPWTTSGNGMGFSMYGPTQ